MEICNTAKMAISKDNWKIFICARRHTRVTFLSPRIHTRGARRKQNIAHVLRVDRDSIKLGSGADEKVGPHEVGLVGAQSNGRVQCVALTGQHNLMMTR
jgi:hypothetical protein